MKKIGIFTGFFLPHVGGVERYVDKLSEGLHKLGYELVIVTFNESSVKNYEKTDKFSIYRLPVFEIAKSRYPIPKVNAEYRELKNKIEQEKIDYFVVNTRFHLTSLIGARIGRRSAKPVFLIEHGTDHFSVNNKFFDYFGAIYEHILTTIIKQYVDRFYGVSKNCGIWLKHFSIKASGVFYNAVSIKDKSVANDTYERSYPKDEIIITYAGRLIKEKGVLNLLETFMKLKDPKNIRLVIAGDGELLETIRRKYTSNNIDILGRLNFEQIMSLYKRTDIFVYPSMYPEGLPTSILEAGLMECAIIATPRGGTEEVIIDDDHGIIIDGSTESLREALMTLISSSEKRKRLSEAVRRQVEMHFEWDAVAKKLDEEIKGFNHKLL